MLTNPQKHLAQEIHIQCVKDRIWPSPGVKQMPAKPKKQQSPTDSFSHFYYKTTPDEKLKRSSLGQSQIIQNCTRATELERKDKVAKEMDLSLSRTWGSCGEPAAAGKEK